ncbi:helix-turn-helix domain-containing protein [Neorhizobium petrolearium]|uniref:helix-turn-helix domain-containing protein n=1 Tax=Neorhizobium petrolearium TaxID=515361 RepID=UPI003F7F82F4
MIRKQIIFSIVILLRIIFLDWLGSRKIFRRVILKVMICLRIKMRPESESLQEIGRLLKTARKCLGLTQEQVADMAGISRPRYREIETGSAAARATTLINIARALGLELMLIPQAMVPAVDALLQPHDDEDDLPAFATSPDGDADA